MRLLVALLMFLALAVPATAQGSNYEVTVYARESGCPDGKDFCFVVVGSLAKIEPGDKVTFTLINEGNTGHELVVVPFDDRDRQHKDTDEATALGEIEEIGPGRTASATFTVPDSGFYFWCALPGHETLGMWVEAPVAKAEKDSPSPVAFAVLGLIAAAIVLRRR